MVGISRIGVYICHCGTNISATINVENLTKRVAKLRNAKAQKDIYVARDYKYLCSKPGQELIQNDIKNMNLDRVVIAACSPRMHESTYKKVLIDAGLNPFLLEIANIREQASWVHTDKEKATDKAFDLINISIAKVRSDEPLASISSETIQRVLVIGAGIAGIQTSLDIANTGYDVVLVEKEQSIGGRMSQLGKTFPTLDCSACILTPRMVEVASNPRIKLYTYSEVEEISGFVGNFVAKIRKKSRSVNQNCTGCGTCTEKCPTKILNEYDENMGQRKAIYTLFPQAVPNIPVIDRSSCLYITKGKCGVCKKVCPAGAIDYDIEDELIEENIGAVVVASGFDLFNPISKEEYGFGIYKNVITGLQLERLMHTAGPTKGEIIRPSDKSVPKRIAFVQCVGSRDEHSNKYCSRVCCMYAIKNALLIKEHNPDSDVYIYYIDIRAFGKGYEEFYMRAQENGIKFMRGRVAEIDEEQDTKNLVIRADDTLLGMVIENEVDMVVLSTGIIPRLDSSKIQKMLGLAVGPDGFFMEAHAKLRPVETLVDGVFLAGTVQGPKDIPDTVAQAKGAASGAMGIISHKTLELSPLISEVDKRLCRGCGDCKEVCEYGAIDLELESDGALLKGVSRKVARINPALCKGCGSCSVVCCNGSIKLKNYTDITALAMIEAALGGGE